MANLSSSQSTMCLSNQNNTKQKNQYLYSPFCNTLELKTKKIQIKLCTQIKAKQKMKVSKKKICVVPKFVKKIQGTSKGGLLVGAISFEITSK